MIDYNREIAAFIDLEGVDWSFGVMCNAVGKMINGYEDKKDCALGLPGTPGYPGNPGTPGTPGYPYPIDGAEFTFAIAPENGNGRYVMVIFTSNTSGVGYPEEWEICVNRRIVDIVGVSGNGTKVITLDLGADGVIKKDDDVIVSHIEHGSGIAPFVGRPVTNNVLIVLTGGSDDDIESYFRNL
jgi:hypothetical protein